MRRRRSYAPRRDWIGAAICFTVSLIAGAVAALIAANYPNGILEDGFRQALELALMGSGAGCVLFAILGAVELQPRRR